MDARFTRQLFSLLLLIILLMGCKAQAGEQTTSHEVTAVPTKPAATAVSTIATVTTPTATAVPPTPTAMPFVLEQIGDFYILPDGPLPPADYASALLSQVEAGEIELAEGIVAGLDFLLGEVVETAVFGPIPPTTPHDIFPGIVALRAFERPSTRLNSSFNLQLIYIHIGSNAPQS